MTSTVIGTTRSNHEGKTCTVYFCAEPKLYKLILCGFGFSATTAPPWMQQLSKGYEGSSRLWSRFWMSERDGRGRRPKPLNWVGEESRPWPKPPGCRA